jgi:16S rRNA (cytosine1402-N4)-methyltransferase
MAKLKKIFSEKITPYYKNLTKKPIIPSESEIIINKRARSAKLRIAAKI